MPQSLRRLLITECDFGVGIGVGDRNRKGEYCGVLEKGVIGVMEMVGESKGGYRLREVGVEIVEGGVEAPERVLRAIKRLGWGGGGAR